MLVFFKAVDKASFDVIIVTFFLARVIAVYSSSRVRRVSVSSVIEITSLQFFEELKWLAMSAKKRKGIF